MENPESYKLLGANSMKDLLLTLPIPAILKFREAAKKVHTEQLDLIDNVLKEKGYIEDHMRIPAGGYHD